MLATKWEVWARVRNQRGISGVIAQGFQGVLSMRTIIWATFLSKVFPESISPIAVWLKLAMLIKKKSQSL